MHTSAEVRSVMAGVGFLALAAFAAYGWGRRRRARRIGAWVRAFLSDRYGAVSAGLTVDCSDDALWPVLAAFNDPRTGARHRLWFACWGPSASYALLPGPG